MGKVKLSAADIYTGTLDPARFPATLPAVSGANLTSLNASNLTSGTISASLLPPQPSGFAAALLFGGF